MNEIKGVGGPDGVKTNHIAADVTETFVVSEELKGRLEERRDILKDLTQGFDMKTSTYMTLSKSFLHQVKVSLAKNRAKLYQYHRAMRQPFANIQGVMRGRKVRKANQSR